MTTPDSAMTNSQAQQSVDETARAPDLPRSDVVELDPKQVRIFHDPHGFLRATVGDRTYLEVSVVRAFPLSSESRYIGLLSGRLEEIGVIVDPEELDLESRETIAGELTRRYFSTHILQVTSIREEFGATYWDVVTDRGPREFVSKGLRDNVTYLSGGRLLIPDVDGNRYEIPDLNALDDDSRAMVLRVI